MFPPKTRNIWSDSDNPIARLLSRAWNPIGIQTVELARSWKTNPDAPCPFAETLIADMPNSVPLLGKLLNDTVDFRERVLKYSGVNSTDWRVYGFLYDGIFAEQAYFGNSFRWPKWLDNVGPDTLEQLKQFNAFNFAVFSKESVPEEILRLRTGVLLAELIENMKTAAETVGQPKGANKKLFTYTSHDVMVGYLMSLFGVFKGIKILIYF